MYEYADNGIVTIPVNEKKTCNHNNWNDGIRDLSHERIDKLFESKFSTVTGLAVLITNANPGLSCVDIDTHHEDTINKIVTSFPSHINKRGMKGCSFFFQTVDQQGILKFTCPEGFVEVFYSNKYVVIPPSLHSMEGKEGHHYFWIDEGCTLLSTGLDDLPFISRDEIEGLNELVTNKTIEQINSNRPIQLQYDQSGMADGRYNAIGTVIGSYIKRKGGIVNISEIVEAVLKYDAENFPKNSFFLYSFNKKHKEIKQNVSRELNAMSYVQALLISIEKREKLFFSESITSPAEVIDMPSNQFREFIEIKSKSEFAGTFTAEMIPPFYRQFCIDLAASFGVALHVVFYPLLAAHASFLQSKFIIRPHRHLSFFQRPNLGVILLGASGSKKSDIVKSILWRVKQINMEMKNVNPKELLEEEYRINKRMQNLNKDKDKAYSEGKDDEAEAMKKEFYSLQDELDLLLKDKKPTKHMYQSASVQKMIKDHADNSKGGLFFAADEFQTYLSIMKKKGNEEFRTYFMESMNGDNIFASSTLSRGDDIIDPCFASCLSTLQPSVYKTKIDDLHNPRMTENDGFWQRLIFVDMGRPSMDRTGEFNPMKYKKQYDLFDFSYELHPRDIHLREDAIKAYDEARRKIELRADLYYNRDVLKSFLSKHEGRLCKYALLAEWFMTEGRCNDISKEAIDYAMKWLDYEGSNTIHQFQAHDSNEDYKALNRIIDNINCGVLVDGETVSKWQQNLRGVFRSMSEFTRYIKILENHGYILVIEINGKSSIVKINPMMRSYADRT
jgi:hypothetical protein